MQINIKNNFDQIRKTLDQKYAKQVPYALKETLNVLAGTAQRVVISEMKTQFDKPTPFTLNSTRIEYAKVTNLRAIVKVKDAELFKSKSLAESLIHEFRGGSRIRKRLEYWLQKAGYISSMEYVVPGEGAKLDAYGNMQRGQITQILSQLSAGSDAYSYRSGSSRSKAKRAAAGYFWSRGGKLKRGVWQRFNFAHGGAVKPILIVISSPRYQQKINMDAIAHEIINRDFDSEFKKQFDKAVSTAR